MLDAPLGGFTDPGAQLALLARSWEKPLTGYQVTSQGQLITLEVRVGNAVAIATLGREPG